MKTLEEFFAEINGSKQLQEELKNVKSADDADAFLKKYDCGATAEELAECIKAQSDNRDGELTDDEASAASGGRWFITDAGWIEVDETIPPKRKKATSASTAPVTPTYQPGGVIIIEDE